MPNSATPWTAAYQAPLSMGFSRQEYWSRVLLSDYLGSILTLLNLLIAQMGLIPSFSFSVLLYFPI